MCLRFITDYMRHPEASSKNMGMRLTLKCVIGDGHRLHEDWKWEVTYETESVYDGICTTGSLERVNGHSPSFLANRSWSPAQK